jgi:hypothetical protein
MSGSFSLRRLALVVGLAVLGLAGAAPVARADDFRAGGTFTLQSQQGANIVVAVPGRAKPGGKFDGVFVGKESNSGKVRGVQTCDFGRGDTLTIEQNFAFDEALGLWVGTYLITGGTGALAGASGEGVFLAEGGGGAGTYEMVGTIRY